MSRLRELWKEVEKVAQRDIEAANQSGPYFEAKRDLEERQRFRQILDAKIASDKIDLEMPKAPLVEIVDRATPALRPISPNLPRAVGLIALGILLDLVGLLMLTGVGGDKCAKMAQQQVA